jgi:O-antigen/teichoic acid export membrane protein
VFSYSPRLRLDRVAAGELLRFGRFILLSGILGFACIRMDVILVPKFLGMVSAGVYSVAVAIVMIVTNVVNNVADRALYPAFCEIKGDLRRFRARHSEILEVYCNLVTPLLLVITANADLIIAVLYDPRYRPAGFVLQWLLIGCAIQGLARMLNLPVMASGRSYVGTIASVGFLIGLCLFLPPLARYAGLQGYALAKMLASCGLIVPLTWFCLKLGYLEPRVLLWHLRVPFVMSVALVAIGWWARQVAEEPVTQIVTAMGSLLVLSLIMLTWQREFLLRSAAGLVRTVPWLNERGAPATSRNLQAINT